MWKRKDDNNVAEPNFGFIKLIVALYNIPITYYPKCVPIYH